MGSESQQEYLMYNLLWPWSWSDPHTFLHKLSRTYFMLILFLWELITSQECNQDGLVWSGAEGKMAGTHLRMSGFTILRWVMF